MELTLDANATERLIHEGLASVARSGIAVEEVRYGYARVRVPYREDMLRPGGVISGPTLFAAADTAMYALVLSHVGPELMALTSEMNLHFLSKAPPGDVIAEARLLKLGRRLVVMAVELRSSGGTALVAQATGTYARPDLRAARG